MQHRQERPLAKRGREHVSLINVLGDPPFPLSGTFVSCPCLVPLGFAVKNIIRGATWP